MYLSHNLGRGQSACQAGARATLGQNSGTVLECSSRWVQTGRRIGDEERPAVRPVPSTDVGATSTNQSQHRFVILFARQVDPALRLLSGDDRRRKGRRNITCRQSW